jgi:hypothetical protein
MTPVICSIVPIGTAVALIGLIDLADPHILRPGNWGDFGGFLYGPVLLCVGLLIALVTIPLGTYSVLSGSAAIREPEARGKTLVVFAIILGILEIVIGTGYLFWTFSKVF